MDDWREALTALCGDEDGADATSVQDGVARLQQRFGVALPPAYTGFMRRVRPGHCAAFGEFDVLPVNEALRVLDDMAAFRLSNGEEVAPDIAGDTDERVRRLMWDANRIPFAHCNGDIWLCIDYSPASHGVAGQIIQMDPEALSWRWLAPSFDALLIDLANGRELDPEW